MLDPGINIDFNEEETVARLKLVKKLNKHGFQFKITNSIKKTMKLQQNKERGSQFIGVSKNGSCWQVALVLADQKHYICSVDDISIAAIINDMVTIQNKGKDGKTNFSYEAKHCAALLVIPSIVTLLDK